MPVADGSQRPPMMRTFKATRSRAGFLTLVPISIVCSVQLAQSPRGFNEIELDLIRVFLSFILACLVGSLIRLPWAYTVQVQATAVVYRSMYRTQRIPMEDLVQAQNTTRSRRGRDWALPSLQLRDGRNIHLTEFGVPVASGWDPNSDLVTTINERISQHADMSH
jgi:hypothetical protein